ncbi:MAG: hypothetical protein QOG68_1337, partial [Solirubrobacteraceae bacterium]|nr:hypothetical protein [Solirubrobacteraceae bacterium]
NTTTNTQWIRTTPNASWPNYRLHINYFLDNNLVSGGGVYVPVSTTQASIVYADWQGIVNTLVEGHRYVMCGTPENNDGSVWWPESQNSCGAGIISNKLTNTDIDRTKPGISVSVDGSATFTKDPVLAYHVGYSDNLSPPFPANFLCVAKGTPGSVCTAGGDYTYNAPCSTPNAVSNVTSFDCSQNIGSAGDGTYNLCVISADSAIPDNPSSSDQSRLASTANLSPNVCGYVTVDRVAPTVTPSASSTSVHVGDLVTFTAAGSDASSGLNNQWAWTWGDNTSNGSGASATHTFTQAGTYSVSLGTADNAGNAGTGTVTMTVAPAPSGGTGTPPPTTGTPPATSTTGTPPSTTGTGTPPATTSTGTGTGTPPATTGTGTTPATTGPTSGGTVYTAPSAVDLSKSAGGGGTQSTGVGKLSILAPRTFRLGGKSKALPMALTAQSAGSAKFALVRNGKILARGSLTITKPGTVGFRFKLPRTLKPGSYTLQVTFVPTGTTKGVTKTLHFTVKAAIKKKAHGRAVSSVSSAGLPPPSLPDGRLH